jgi:hypothetical protein
MVRKVRLITDSMIKNAAARAVVEATALKEELVKNRKKALFRSDSVKVEVIKTYIALGGNLTLTAGATNIPLRTLKAWKATNWWKSLFNELKKAEKLELSAKTKTIIERSMELLADRLEHGDPFYHPKTGEIIRKAVPAAQLHQIAKDMIDRKNILDKAFEEKIVSEPTGNKLADLAERFAKLAEMSIQNKKPTVEVTDVVFATEEKRLATNES